LITLLWPCYINKRCRFLRRADNSGIEKGLPNGLNRVTLLTAVQGLVVGTNGVGIHRVVPSNVITPDTEAVTADHRPIEFTAHCQVGMRGGAIFV
jgi:hypothetical protein